MSLIYAFLLTRESLEKVTAFIKAIEMLKIALEDYERRDQKV